MQTLDKDATLPLPFTVQCKWRELKDTFTLELRPDQNCVHSFNPGQFNMLYAFGTGDVPISISGDPETPERLIHTIRSVGKTTEALCRLRPGDKLGVRGPFGSGWPIDPLEGQDIVIMAGGIGLAPLRPAIYSLLHRRRRYGRITILYGARSPNEIIYLKELTAWRGRFDTQVEVTVDHADSDWSGKVGVVTKLLNGISLDAAHTSALICGPEVMMRFCAQTLLEKGVSTEALHVSMERNMKCALGHCGHCQLGSAFVCRDGPVFTYARIDHAFHIKEM